METWERRGQDQLVDRRASPERQGSPEPWLGENLDEHAGEDKVVLDLVIARPRHDGTPVGDEGRGDQTSGSTRALIRSRQRSSRAALCARPPLSQRTQPPP